MRDALEFGNEWKEILEPDFEFPEHWSLEQAENSRKDEGQKLGGGVIMFYYRTRPVPQGGFSNFLLLL